MARYVVCARSDGRGGFSPFRTHPSAHAGEEVAIGDRFVKVSSDGRVNIPKALMEKVGTKGEDGRYRVVVEAGARTDPDRGKHYGLYVTSVPAGFENAPTGTVVPDRIGFVGDVIHPSDTVDYYLED